MKMKFFTKLVLIGALSISMIAPTIAVQNLSGQQVVAEAATVRLSKKALKLKVGQKATLTVKGTSKKVKWSVGNKYVATVNKKGKVSAVSNGSTYVYAKVGNKTLSCIVTVTFDAAKAKSNISCQLQDTGSGVVAILKNNNKFSVNIDAKLAYYKDGAMIDTAEDYNPTFENGKECALFFHEPEDADYNDLSYDDYKISISVTPSSYASHVSAISEQHSISQAGVTTEATNTSKYEIDISRVACVMYDASGKAIGYDYHYLDCKYSGDTDYFTFSFPYDSDYNTIIPTSCKVYINSAY